jgi:hypothetical protein
LSASDSEEALEASSREEDEASSDIVQILFQIGIVGHVLFQVRILFQVGTLFQFHLGEADNYDEEVPCSTAVGPAEPQTSALPAQCATHHE